MDTNETERKTWSLGGFGSQQPRAIQTLRGLLLVEAVSLLVAAALHAGILTGGSFEQAAIYEGSLGVIVAVALGLTFLAPDTAGPLGLAAQALTLAGASLGLYLALLGVAPHTSLDIVYHVVLIGLLVVGLGVAWRVGRS
jgi:hypothetical protein